MSVVKRDGKVEEMSLDKISKRIRTLLDENNSSLQCNVMAVTMGVCENIHDMITTYELDMITINICNKVICSSSSYKDLARLVFNSWCEKYHDVNAGQIVALWQKIMESSYNMHGISAHITSDVSLDMYVIGRSGEKKMMSLDEITKRITHHANVPTKLNVDVMTMVIATISNMKNEMTTSEIDELSAWIASTYSLTNADYEVLGTRIALDDLYKNTPHKFSSFIEDLASGDNPIIRRSIANFVSTNADTLDAMCQDGNAHDTNLNYFAIATLKKLYLLLDNHGKPHERPQYTWMRIAVELWNDTVAPSDRWRVVDNIRKCYEILSDIRATHASPTVFNSSTTRPQLSSCMLVQNEEDSVEGIYYTFAKCAQLGAATAGIGIDMSNIRATNSMIKSSRRPSKGLPSFVSLYDMNCQIIDQGGKRKMSIAIYIPPWHADFLRVLHMAAPDVKEDMRAHNLFYAVWHNSLLFKRVQAGENWSMFCPTDVPDLLKLSGKAFDDAYLRYEAAGLAREVVPAKQIYIEIAKLMYESGKPYNLNADACNEKSNLQNVANTPCSNLCAEIVIPSGMIDGQREIGVCTLASINLPKHVKSAVSWVNGIPQIDEFNMDWEELQLTTRQLVRNLNQVIDRQLYVLEECRRSNLRHRPIGIGYQGLSDIFQMAGLPMESPEANKLQARITEVIALAAVDESCELAKIHGPYDTFEGSPASEGRLQPHLWDEYYRNHEETYVDGAPRTDVQSYVDWPAWDALAKKVQTYGLRNGLLLALMPTSSTSQLTGNTPSMDPQFSNIYSRHGLTGDFYVTNKQLIAAIKSMNMWNEMTKDLIVLANGSVQDIPATPEIKAVFKTAHEVSQKQLMFMSACRGQFICQTQSLNVYLRNADISKFVSLISYGMKLGLKTISYYTFTESSADAAKVTVKKESRQFKKESRQDEKKNTENAAVPDDAKLEVPNAQNTQDMSQNTSQQRSSCPRRKKGQPIDECTACQS